MYAIGGGRLSGMGLVECCFRVVNINNDIGGVILKKIALLFIAQV